MSWLKKLKQGLSKSSNQITENITAVFTKRKLDAEALEALEELLIMADLGVENAARITASLGAKRLDKEVTDEEIKEALAEEIALVLEPYAKPLELEEHKPQVIMMVGVNGNGKTTTIGKLAKQYREQGMNVMLCAADTFRAAAVEQLQRWGERTEVPVVTGAMNADPASVAYQALEQAQSQGADVLMIDTAGRLQNKKNLMAELEKIHKVLGKLDESAPHQVILVLDATTGQNALSQLAAFKELVDVSGIIVTKLDGSARAGVVVALADKFKLPIHAIGVGEGVDDLQPFNAQDFARNLVGISS
jgi:fused signal recognition particle receptor